MQPHKQQRIRWLSDPLPETNFSESSFPSSSPTNFLASKPPSPSNYIQRNYNECCLRPDRWKSRWFSLKRKLSSAVALMATVKNQSLDSVSNARKSNAGGWQRRQELEQEVADLQRMLENEEKVHEVLERAMLPHATRSTLYIPNFLPKRTKELLAELVMVEEEIARLESEVSKIQQETSRIQEEKANESLEFHPYKNTRRSSVSISPIQDSMSKTMEEKLALETKPMFFINQAIKGDYTLNGFTSKSRNHISVEAAEKKENRRLSGFQERVPKKSGVIEKQSSPRPARHSASKTSDSNAQMLVKFLQDPSLVPNPMERNGKKWQPNKLSEKIMKCLICIFLRLMRTTRVMELEKLGNLSRSSNSFLRSRSFQAENGFISTTSLHSQREAGQQDPYGIFEMEDSLMRDIGPYKNLVRFTSSSFDLKGISSSLPLLGKLRALLNNLRDVDLRFLNNSQKLAFWINIYNTCIMHGFLEHGLPSSPEKVGALKIKAVLDIGGNKLNALAIEHFILRQPSNRQEAYWKGDKDDSVDAVQSLYGLEQPEPNITFALCCGSRSSPSVRIYTADGVSAELEKAKLEYLQASIVVTTAKRLMIPKLLVTSIHNFATDLGSLVEWICNQLPTSGSLRKSMAECMKGQSSNVKISDIVDIMPCDFEFQYLLPM